MNQELFGRKFCSAIGGGRYHFFKHLYKMVEAVETVSKEAGNEFLKMAKKLGRDFFGACELSGYCEEMMKDGFKSIQIKLVDEVYGLDKCAYRGEDVAMAIFEGRYEVPGTEIPRIVMTDENILSIWKDLNGVINVEISRK